MTTKITSTTHNAGVPPAPPEAHQRAGVIQVKAEDVEALKAMLKNPAPTIRAAAVALIRDLRAAGFLGISIA